MGLHFTKEEFSKRKSKVIQIMKEQKIDALLMLDKSLCTGLQDTIRLDMFFSKL